MIRSWEVAQARIRDFERDVIADEPGLETEVGLHADAVEAVALECHPHLARQLCSLELGYMPNAVNLMIAGKLEQAKAAKAEADRRRTDRRNADKELARQLRADQESAHVAENTCPRCWTLRSSTGVCNC